MTRQELILSMTNKYDFAEFSKKSEELGIQAISWLLYVQVVETLDLAMEKYPDVAPSAAYLQLLSDTGNTLVTKEVVTPADAPKVACGSCGGGRVL